MKKITSEVVELFWEDSKPVAFLLMNGHAEFYKCSKANKDFVRERLLEIGTPPAIVEESVTPLK